MEPTTSRPSPGHANTVSTIMFPPRSSPICSPATVSAGIRAFRSACLITTAVSGRPLARAVVTYRRCSTSIMDDRTVRASTAANTTPSVSDGSTRWRSVLATAAPLRASTPSISRNPVTGGTAIAGSICPDVGSSRAFTAKKRISSRPNQNAGMLAPRSDVESTARSTHERGRSALRRPIGTAMSTATATVATVSSMVAGSASAISAATGRCWTIDVPRSPCASCAKNSVNCTCSGRSRWSSCRSVLIVAPLVLVSPSMIWTGSPGRRWSEKNASTATPAATGTASSIRWTILSQRIGGVHGERPARLLVARLPQQLPRLRRIVRIRLQRGIVPEAVRQKRRAQPRPVPVVDVAENRVPVDGVVQRLPHPWIVERLRFGVELDLVGPRTLRRPHLDVRICLQAVHEIRGNLLDDVDFAGQQRGDPPRRLGQHPEDDLPDFGGAAPVAVVALQHNFGVEGAPDEPERTGADGLGDEAAFAGLLHVLLRNDLEVHERLEDQRLRKRGAR